METGRNTQDIGVFYARGLERDRLARGQGALEFARTTVLLERYLPGPASDVIDVGGGPGRYALWLAERGYRVHLVDPVPLHVDQARAASASQPGRGLASAEIGDARELRFPDESADAVLLLGPLYHLQERDERIRALAEARRVCRNGGVVIAAAISRFASAMDGLLSGYVTDPAFTGIVAGDLRDGRHRNPTGHPAYFTTAYFHRPEELAAECDAAALTHQETLAVEGFAWLLPDLDAWLADDARKSVLLNTLAQLEAEPALMGASAHLLCVARRG